MSQERAGFIPYVYENGVPLYYFMTPSDAKFGGDQPSLAKGRVDDGETVKQAAVREAEEELGLKRSNIKHETIQLAWKGKIRGQKESYTMVIYMGEVKDKEDFNAHDHETGSTHWLTVKEFAKQGRESQVKIVKAAERLLSDKSVI